MGGYKNQKSHFFQEKVDKKHEKLERKRAKEAAIENPNQTENKGPATKRLKTNHEAGKNPLAKRDAEPLLSNAKKRKPAAEPKESKPAAEPKKIKPAAEPKKSNPKDRKLAAVAKEAGNEPAGAAKADKASEKALEALEVLEKLKISDLELPNRDGFRQKPLGCILFPNSVKFLFPNSVKFWMHNSRIVQCKR